MANVFYTKSKEKLLSGTLSFTNGLFKVALLKQSYTVNPDTHEFLSDIASFRVGTDQTLGNIAVTGGAVNADNPTFPSVAAGETVASIVIYKDSGVAGTSPLVFYIDEVTGFPFYTNGASVTPEWDTGPKKIYKL